MKRRLLLLGVAALLVLGAAAYPVGRLLWARHRQGLAREAAERYDYDLAYEHARACAEAFPGDPSLALQCARLARKAGRYDRARAHLDDLRDLAGQEQAAAREELLLAAQQGQLPPADERRLLDLARGDPAYGCESLEALARGSLENYRLADTLALDEELLAARPEYAPAHYLRGLLWEGQGGLTEAAASYRKAVALQPEYFAARLRLAEVYLARNQPLEARPEFERLAARRPEQFAPRFGLARCLRLTGQAGQAGRLLDELARAYPDEPALCRERARLALASGRWRDAESLYRRANGLEPLDPDGLYALAQSLQRQGRGGEAGPWLKKREAMERDAAALHALHEEIAHDPFSVERRRRAAVLCFRNGRDGEALRWLAGALQLAPEDAEVRRLLADYYDRSGQPALARKYRAAGTSP